MGFRKRIALLVCVMGVLLWLAPCVALAEETGDQKKEVESIYEESGAAALYDALDEDTRELLEKGGIQEGIVQSEEDGNHLFQAFSQVFREKISAPLKGLAALLGVVILCRLGSLFEQGKETAQLVGTLSCAGILASPLLALISATSQVIESASVFMVASVPVYSALMIASGSGVTGGSYSFWTLAFGNGIPVLASALLLPLLRAFLMLALTSALCRTKLDRLLSSIYNFTKWILVLSVTLFSGILSVQTMLNAQVDAATNKAVKLLASSAIPIVGGAFGDAVAAIQNSVHIVKSGVGAFGMLAAVCIFAPTAVEAALWVGVSLLGQIASDLMDVPYLGSLFGACASVGKMILAVLASVCAVAVVCAALVLFVKGSL